MATEEPATISLTVPPRGGTAPKQTRTQRVIERFGNVLWWVLWVGGAVAFVLLWPLAFYG